MRDFQAFLARLGDALEQQRQVVEQARAAHQAAIVVWREAAKRAHVVDTLAERWQVEGVARGRPPRSARQRRVVAAARVSNRESKS